MIKTFSSFIGISSTITIDMERIIKKVKSVMQSYSKVSEGQLLHPFPAFFTVSYSKSFQASYIIS